MHGEQTNLKYNEDGGHVRGRKKHGNGSPYPYIVDLRRMVYGDGKGANIMLNLPHKSVGLCLCEPLTVPRLIFVYFVEFSSVFG